MTDHLPIATAQIFGFFVESVFYGLYLDTFVRCLYVLMRAKGEWKSRFNISWGLVVVTLLLFVNGTLNISLGLLRFIQQFALQIGSVSWVNTIKVFTVNFQSLMGEGVMIYRCFHVWGKSWAVAAVPLALWIAALGIILRNSWLQWTKNVPVTSGSLAIATTVFWGLSAAINLYTTGMIVYRIWKVRRDAQGFISTGRSTPSSKKTPLDSIIRIIVDSGLGYALVSFTQFFSAVAKSNAQYITSAADIQVVGIAFNLINIRVGDLMNEEQDATRVVDNADTFNPVSIDAWNVAHGPVSTTASNPTSQSNSLLYISEGKHEKSIATDDGNRSIVC